MRAELEKTWTEGEEARTTVRVTFVSGSAFRALRKVRRKLSGVMKTAEDRYLEVYADKLEEFTKAGDMKSWYSHVKGR